MSNTEITIKNIIPTQRKNSRFVTTPEKFYENKKERWNVIISADRLTVTIFGKNYQGKEFSKTFRIGDYAEYDSYNLSYNGPITKITEKSITVRKQYGERNHRLDLYKFCCRNYDFDLDTVAQKNSNTMMYI